MGLLGAIRRLPDGGVRVRLSSRERELLRSLPGQLRPLLSGEQDLVTETGRVQDRLFPPAYDDTLDEMEYRELVGSQPGEERLAALEDFARTLEGGTLRRLSWLTDLTAEEADAWLSALNDARLTLAMIVGVTEERQWETGPDRSDATSVALSYLGWLQEELLGALMGRLEDESE
ncbi:MAG: DUF2017 family protein [Nitriliruptorales bacterium]|nr:DUF2017 family protein [Nitriliruptorales bacterium]